MNLAFGIVTALYARERTGLGQKVEVSLYGTQIALQAPEIQHTLHTGTERARDFRAGPTAGHYECGDGRWVMVVGIDQKFWPRLAEALGLEAIAEDPRFARGWGRYSNREVLEPMIEAAFKSAPAAHWLERLRAVQHPAAIIRGYEDIAQDEQARANGYIVDVDHPRFGRQPTIGLHIQLQGTPGAIGGAAPELGASTDEALRSLGLDEGAIADLRASGVIGSETAS